MTKGTFGEQLKREREMRGVSLDEIAAATRIAPRFLRAIENEEWDQLPGGVFNRGFVRAVAHYLGLDEESIVAEYGMVVGVRPSVPVWTGSPPAVAPSQPWLAWILAAVLAVALIAGGFYGVRRIFAWRAARRAGQIVISVDSPSSSADAPASPAPAISSDASPSLPTSSAPANDSAGSSTSAVAPATIAPSAPAAAPSTPAAAAVPLELNIQTDKKTRITVATDAQRVFEGNIRPGEARTFSAQDQFQVSAKDAGALQLKFNGKTLGPIAPPGHPGKITLTREALKEAPGGGN